MTSFLQFMSAPTTRRRGLLTAGWLALAGSVPRVRAAPATRDWRTWPFNRDSPWNMPLGEGARFAQVAGLSSVHAGLNYDDRWTSAVVISRDSDPLVHVLINTTWETSNWGMLARGVPNCGASASQQAEIRAAVQASDKTFTANPWSSLSPRQEIWKLPPSYHPASADFRSIVHFRPGACPSPDTDGLMANFQPDGWVLDTYATIVLANGDIVSGGVASFVDARGDGTGWWNGRRASMIPSFAGLIRTGELAAGHIPHAMAMVISSRFLAPTVTWPAFAFDRNSHAYSGSLPMGSLLGIPPAVDIDTLGLTDTGKVVARAAQNFGIYLVDSTNGDGATLLAELNDPELRWPGWHRDVATVIQSLQLVTNTSQAQPGGPGKRRAPLAPDFAVN